MQSYEEQDAALDEEIRGLYSDNADDDSLDTSTESESNETETELDHSTPEPVNTETEEKPMVEEHRYKEAVRAMNEAQRELANYRKQDTERDALIQRLQSEINELKSAKTEPEPNGDEDDLDEYQRTTVKPLLKIIDDLKKQLADVKGEVNGVKSVATRMQEAEALTSKQLWEYEVKKVHPDFEDINASHEFIDWLENQPDFIRKAAPNATPQDAIKILNMFRADNPVAEPVHDNKPDKLDKARQASNPNVKSGGKPEKKLTFTQKQIEKMSRDEFLKHEAAIDEALARGEVTY